MYKRKCRQNAGIFCRIRHIFRIVYVSLYRKAGVNVTEDLVHDLRMPLQLMKSCAQLLEEETE